MKSHGKGIFPMRELRRVSDGFFVIKRRKIKIPPDG
jgi:hypothetical protein